MKIVKSGKTGFCFGVKRAITLLENVAMERGGVETLGAVVHNEQVLQRLAQIGVKVARNVDDIKGDIVVTSSHGVSPQVEEQIKARHIEIISATCPFVHRAQIAARRLSDSGFFVVVYGDADHPEVRGILGWAQGKGKAVAEKGLITTLGPLPRRLGILSQTTQIPARFTEFVLDVVASALTRDAEIRVIDTICHDIRERQTAALELASQVDLMLVIGGRNSANTHHLVDLCSTATVTHQIETADDIKASWLRCQSVGVAAGASTAEETVGDVMARLEAMAQTPKKG